jgi:hypothetical protein
MKMRDYPAEESGSPRRQQTADSRYIDHLDTYSQV